MFTNRLDDSHEGEYKGDTVHASIVDPSTMKENVELYTAHKFRVQD